MYAGEAYIPRMKPHDQDRLVRTCVFLPVGLRDRLKATASARRVSMAQLVRAALEGSVGSIRPEPTGGFLVSRDQAIG